MAERATVVGRPTLRGSNDHGAVASVREGMTRSDPASVSGFGRYVLFPNVDTSTAIATIGGDPTGSKVVPIAAGQLSLIAISFVFIGP